VTVTTPPADPRGRPPVAPRRRSRREPSVFRSRRVIGTLVLLIMGFLTYLAYGANFGLPFVPTYDLTVDVPNGDLLLPGDQVRIGGALVGIVNREVAINRRGAQPYAQLSIALTHVKDLPVDTRAEIRPQSLLGEMYLALIPGHSRKLIPQDGTIPLGRAITTVSVNDALKVFGPSVQHGLRGTIAGLGDMLAGRGPDLNSTIQSISELLPGVERISALLLSPRTDLPGFIDAADSATATIAPVAQQLGQLITGGAGTLSALAAARGQLAATIDDSAPTELTATSALNRITPVLADASLLARDLRQGAALLPTATDRLAGALDAGTPALRDAPVLAAPLSHLAGALLSATSPRDPVLAQSLDELDATVQSLRGTLDYLLPAQLTCNVLGVTLRNEDSVIDNGNVDGPWLNIELILDTSEGTQVAKPSPDLHTDPFPIENASQCDAGNEPYLPGQHIGTPTGNVGTATDETAAPAGATALARKAGLLTPVPRRP